MSFSNFSLQEITRIRAKAHAEISELSMRIATVSQSVAVVDEALTAIISQRNIDEIKALFAAAMWLDSVLEGHE